MYGSIVRYRPRPKCEEALEELEQRWLRERAPVVDGFIGTYRVKPREQHGELLSLVLFDSEENYRKNASDPEQDRWYREVRALLVDDPEWNDGEIIERVPETVAL